jgi:hypothetical protein
MYPANSPGACGHLKVIASKELVRGTAGNPDPPGLAVSNCCKQAITFRMQLLRMQFRPHPPLIIWRQNGSAAAYPRLVVLAVDLFTTLSQVMFQVTQIDDCRIWLTILFAS